MDRDTTTHARQFWKGKLTYIHHLYSLLLILLFFFFSFLIPLCISHMFIIPPLPPVHLLTTFLSSVILLLCLTCSPRNFSPSSSLLFMFFLQFLFFSFPLVLLSSIFSSSFTPLLQPYKHLLCLLLFLHLLFLLSNRRFFLLSFSQFSALLS